MEQCRNKPLSEKEKKLLYIGRWTTMKDPRRVLDLGPGLKEKGIASELIGIERSIGAKFDIFDHPNCIDRTGKEEKYISPNACVPVYGTYIRNEGMETLSNCLFGCSFYRLPKEPEAYGDRMEYAMIEIIATGCIPVFDEHWAKHNFRKNGVSYYDTPFSGIYSNKEDLQGTIDTLYAVSLNEDLQKKYFETSYQIVKEEFDANIVLPEMFSYMLSVGKDNNKFKSDEDLIKNVVKPSNTDEFLKLYNEYKDNEIVVLGIRELYTNNIFCILDGKKEKEIQRFK